MSNGLAFLPRGIEKDYRKEHPKSQLGDNEMVVVKGKTRMGRPRKAKAPEDEPSSGSVGDNISALPATEDAGEEIKVAEPKVPEPSQVSEEAAAEKVGYDIGAVSPVEEDQETAESPKAKNSRARTSGEAPAERVGYHKGSLPAVEETPEKRELAEKANAFNSSYGWVELQGKRYEFDVIVHADGSVTKREKGLSKKKKEKYGHTPLTRKELKELGKEAPAMIIIGTGHSGSMPLTPKAERFLEDYLYFVGTTPMALEKLATCEEKAVALLHVTC